MRPELAFSRLAGDGTAERLLVLGPSLGTSVGALWGGCAALLPPTVEVFGWDLPGHGASPPTAAFSVEDLAEAVRVRSGELAAGRPAAYAGVSLGGALVFAPALRSGPFDRLAAIASAPRIGEPPAWRERAALVRRAGTAALVPAAPARWFAPGFRERRPAVAETLLAALAAADDGSYAAACDALAAFDAAPVDGVPIVVCAGEHDPVVPPAQARAVAAAVPSACFHLVTGCGHLPPAEDPEAVAGVLTAYLVGGGAAVTDERYEMGMRVRRDVLGDAHVDRAEAAKTELTADFQAFITRYAWGEVWSRPGLDRRVRSAVTITALIARGHWDELTMHLRAAGGNGLTAAEVAEVILHSAVYCGVPAANHALALAGQVLEVRPAQDLENGRS